MVDFHEQLERINRLADESPGFVWRLKDESGNSTGYYAYGDRRNIVNMSVWESVETLWDYTYQSAHIAVMRRRRDWFDHLTEPYLVLWWVPAGHRPDVPEAITRLDYLRANGPTPYAFTFKRRFTAEQSVRYIAEEGL
jgi:hypothetical protein